MNPLSHKLAAAIVASCCALAIATVAAAQPLPEGPIAAPPEGCRIWEAHILSVIERHKRGGTSDAALGDALSIAYAAYGKCVVCATEKDMNENAVSALKSIQLVLSADRQVAAADEPQGPAPR
jgi:hypothetical protein